MTIQQAIQALKDATDVIAARNAAKVLVALLAGQSGYTGPMHTDAEIDEMSLEQLHTFADDCASYWA